VFSFDYTEATVLPNNRWCVDVDFRLITIGKKKVHPNTVSQMICSPEYANKPDVDIPDKQTLIMEFLDKQKIEDFVRDKIELLNSRHFNDWDNYYEALKEWFYIDD
jgi:hypothetical protein